MDGSYTEKAYVDEEVKEQGQIGRQLTELEMATEEVFKNAEKLERALMPVLRQIDEKSNGALAGTPRIQLPKVGEQIANNVQRTSDASVILRSILSRLEL